MFALFLLIRLFQFYDMCDETPFSCFAVVGFVILDFFSAAAAIVPLLVSPVDEFYLTFKLQIHSVMLIAVAHFYTGIIVQHDDYIYT